MSNRKERRKAQVKAITSLVKQVIDDPKDITVPAGWGKKVEKEFHRQSMYRRKVDHGDRKSRTKE